MLLASTHNTHLDWCRSLDYIHYNFSSASPNFYCKIISCITCLLVIPSLCYCNKHQLVMLLLLPRWRESYTPRQLFMYNTHVKSKTKNILAYISGWHSCKQKNYSCDCTWTMRDRLLLNRKRTDQNAKWSLKGNTVKSVLGLKIP
jgi:hypothetical protein